MKTILEPLKQLRVYEDAWEYRKKNPSAVIEICGGTDMQKLHTIAGMSESVSNKLIVTYSEQRAREIVECYRFFEENTCFFPAKDILFYQSDIRGTALMKERMEAYEVLLEEKSGCIVTTFDALSNRLLPKDIIRNAAIPILVGQELDLTRIRRNLVKMGYESNYQAEQPGQFCVRGGILDIFVLTEQVPYRIELWGEEVDSIRSFDPESQRSIETLEQVLIFPATELIFEEEQIREGLNRVKKDADRLWEQYRKERKTEEAHRVKSGVELLEEEVVTLKQYEGINAYLLYFLKEDKGCSLLDYFYESDSYLIAIDEPARCLEMADATDEQWKMSMEQRIEMGYALPGQMGVLFSKEEILAGIKRCGAMLYSRLGSGMSDFSVEERYEITARSIQTYNNSFELLKKDLLRYKKEKWSVLLLYSSVSRAKKMAADLQAEGISAFYSEDLERIVQPGEVAVYFGKTGAGFEYPDIRFAILTEQDIFSGKKKRKKRHKRYDGQRIAGFSDLTIGDYVVHENHGLGIYRGIEKIETDHVIKDYLKIEYAKSGVLYILATQLELLQKYAGADAKAPKLNTLGGVEWKRTRSRVQKAVGEVAKELISLYAERQRKEGHAFSSDTLWQSEFEEQFPFEETQDQLQAISDTKKDMESRKIMDRLICGDVGFGKTEIAIRAAFKAVQEGKQVVYLVPTTILAQQHYNTFVQRMKDYPVGIELLCRFRTPSQQKKSIEQLKKGLSDIVIGTHRVLSGDVEFKDLGLLIIDEEQRFGVTHKERIKQMKREVDVLTLSATPIPRTLHMSLVGIRDMSVLEEAPQERMPIQTYIMEYNEELVREAIQRELARGGQVYYVFNRVNQIEDITHKLSELIPDAVIAYAHGQMGERQLEKIMYEFMEGEIDVLVSTTIIETGLDIGNVNTMIIQDADKMGLSQLYQLRGRIGRSNRTAYAFLMYRRNTILKEVAEKRLSVIRDFSELGSGFKIAMKDLEIRGAGNVLGEAQSGHMEAVGYDFYCKMLNQAVTELKGEPERKVFDTTVELEMDAYIPSNYIPNESNRLDIYKRIALIEEEKDSEEMMDELIDRFGEPPKVVQNLLLIANLKAKAHQLYITGIMERQDRLQFAVYPEAAIDPAKIPGLLNRYQSRVSFSADKEHPMFVYRKSNRDRNALEVVQVFLEDFSELLI